MAASPTYRFVSITAAVVAFAVLGAWLGLTWDAYLTNFQVRWMCDEDRPYVLRRGDDAASLALPDEALESDARVLKVFSEAFPTVVAASTPEGRAAPYALVDQWPGRVRTYWGFAVVRSELSVVQRPGNRGMGTSGLYRRIQRQDAFTDLRAALSPPAELCTAADRIEFVKRVLKPPA